MILARKSGDLIGCNLLRETPKGHFVSPWFTTSEWYVSKNSNNEKLFDSVPEAQEWILGVNQ